MTNILKTVGIAIVGVVVGFIASSVMSGKALGVYNQTAEYFYSGLYAGTSNQLSVSGTGALATSGGIANTGTLTQGSSGTAVTQLIKGTCNLIGTPTITASSTAPMDCAVTGVVAGDTVFGSAATTTQTGGMSGWSIVGASASSTANYLTFIVSNRTGADAVPPKTATSSVQYLILR